MLADKLFVRLKIPVIDLAQAERKETHHE